MKLPDNSLGISDAVQWEDCPKLFHKSMLRHSLPPGVRESGIITDESAILNYGSAMHDAALAVVHDPDIYIDDAVDAAWKKWSPYLKPEHHEELKQDVGIIIKRTQEARNLELVAAEEDWKVPVFVGRPDIEGDEEEGQWYYYRFKIDALYRRKDDPTHYVIRDFKSSRRRRWQEEIDEDRQFTAYDYGVRVALGEGVEKVTIWYDQVKHGEIFSSRTEEDRVKFQDFIESQIKSILATPTEEVMDTFKLNQWCSWCPMLETCGVVPHLNDWAIAHIKERRSGSAKEDMAGYTADYEKAKQAIKALEEYKDRMGAFLKDNPGRYGGTSYFSSNVEKPTWNVKDAYDVIGDSLLDKLPKVSKSNMKEFLDDPRYANQLMAIRNAGGYERINSKAVKDK